MFRLPLACLALILWVALPGCRLVQLTSKTTAPTPAREPAASLAAEPFDATLHGRGFYPLEVGNRWRYRRTASQRWVENGVPQTIEYASTLERELVCEPSLAGRTYVSELTREIDGTDVYTSWVHFRQDRTGLYERDERGTPGCAAPNAPIVAPVTTSTLARIGEPGEPSGDASVQAARVELGERLALIRNTLGLHAPSMRRPRPAEGELTRLAYPLHVGRTWIIRADPRFSTRVVGIELLRVPAGRFLAYKIRIDSELFSANDRVFVWYGRKGFLKLSAHVETTGTDENGNLIAGVWAEEREVLDGYELAGSTSD